MTDPLLSAAVATVPRGRWAVGVSGGADSVALLRLLSDRADLSLHVVHLNHETRGSDSDADAAFVATLARGLNLLATIAKRSEIEPELSNLPANASSRYRRIRLEIFRRTIDEHGLDGVVLAHHADDQAETIFQRLLRGSGYAGLLGMSLQARVGDVTIHRPLLSIARQMLRDHLQSLGQSWREDASNATDAYLRNRVRRAMPRELSEAMIELGKSCRALHDWVESATPVLSESFETAALEGLPDGVAQAALQRWIIDRGSPAGDLTPAVLDRLVAMAQDAATPVRQHFPGGILVCRRGRRLFVNAEE